MNTTHDDSLSRARSRAAARRAAASSGRAGLAIAAFLLLSAETCGGVLDDPGFDLWCGDQLCSWQVDEGQIAQVPTWHPRDFGVELLGDKAAISQFADRSSADLDCIKFEMIADVEETATVTLQLDYYDDGTVDFEQIVPTSSWARLVYVVALPATYQGIRFRLRKTGAGRAVLAEIEATATNQCLDQPRPVVSGRPAGARCDGGEQCAQGACAVPAYSSDREVLALGVCGACSDDAGCAEGEACGVESGDAPRFLDPFLTCGPQGRHALGELCAGDAECATGVCSLGVCSACRDSADCAAGSCERRAFAGDDPLALWPMPPAQCAPGGGLGAPGDACLDGADCASGACAGSAPLRVCLYDGRTCDADADCPLDVLAALEDVEGDREFGLCVAVGARGGACE